MRNFSRINPSTKRLDAVTVLFYEGIRLSEEEWEKWSSTEETFSPFKILVNPKIWISENFPTGLPEFENCGKYQVRWMPSYGIKKIHDNYVAFITFPQYITNWRLCLVYECSEKHELFIWDKWDEVWVKLKHSHNYYPEKEQPFIRLLHNWMDW